MGKRTWIGVFIIVIGLGFLLDQANIIPFSVMLADWWPLVFILIGVVQLIFHTQTAIFTGPIFIIVGALLLLHQFTDYHIVAYIWPLVIIYIGFIFIFFQAKHDKHVDENNLLQSLSLFSGSEIKSRSNPLQGGSIIAVFGGSEIDLREAVITDDQITIEITSVFGGVSLKVPEDIRVQISGVPIFGGWEDKTRHRDSENDNYPVLHLKCITVFGGVEISD